MNTHGPMANHQGVVEKARLLVAACDRVREAMIVNNARKSNGMTIAQMSAELKKYTDTMRQALDSVPTNTLENRISELERELDDAPQTYRYKGWKGMR